MKAIKLLITIITLISITLIAGCTSSTSNTDYTGKWYAIDSKGTVSKLIITKQEKSFLVTHNDYTFSYQAIFDVNTQPYKMYVSLKKLPYLENKALQIKDGVLELNEREGQGSLIYKDGKFIGKPNPTYKEELTFEKDTTNGQTPIFDKAKEQFEKYISTREKAPQNIKKIQYNINEKSAVLTDLIK